MLEHKKNFQKIIFDKSDLLRTEGKDFNNIWENSIDIFIEYLISYKIKQDPFQLSNTFYDWFLPILPQVSIQLAILENSTYFNESFTFYWINRSGNFGGHWYDSWNYFWLHN